MAVKRGWDRPGTTVCCKAGCSNDRGRTKDGVASVMCDFHTKAWELRLSRLEERYPGQVAPDKPVYRTTPVFTPPSGPMTDGQLCARCHLQTRDFPDNLCEDCRRGQRA